MWVQIENPTVSKVIYHLPEYAISKTEPFTTPIVPKTSKSIWYQNP